MIDPTLPPVADNETSEAPVAAPDEQRLALACEQIKTLEHVQQVESTATAILVFTDTLYCTDPRNDVVHEIGKFRIELPLAGNKICWFNLDRQVHNFHAPHISGSGGACLGNMSSVFPGLLAAREFYAAADLAIAFVQSVNTNDGWGCHISDWPIAEKKE